MNVKTNIWQVALVIAMIIIAVVWLLATRSASIPIESGASGSGSSQSNPIMIDQSQDQPPVGSGTALQQGAATQNAVGSSLNPQQSAAGM